MAPATSVQSTDHPSAEAYIRSIAPCLFACSSPHYGGGSKAQKVKIM